MTIALHDLEAAVADAAILRPEMAAGLAELVTPGDFADPWLGQVFDAAVAMAPEDGGYELVNAELHRRGIDHNLGDHTVCKLYDLRGADLDLPTSEAEVYASIVADTARRRRMAIHVAAAAQSLQAGADTDHVLASLRAGIDAA